MKKNICLVNVYQPLLGIGGIETVSYLLKKAFKDNGYNIWDLFIFDMGLKGEYDIQIANQEQVCSKENINQLLEIIKRHKIDIILLNGGWHNDLLNLCVKAKKSTNVKLILTSHCHPLVRTKEYEDFKDRVLLNTHNPVLKVLKTILLGIKKIVYIKISKRKTKEFYSEYDIKNIDAFVTLCQDYAKYFRSIFPTYFRDSIYTIPNPIIIEPSDSVNKENIILFVGRMTMQKRLDRLLYIWQKIYKKHPEWKVVAVGDGEYIKEYKRIAKSLKLENLEFVGRQSSEEYFRKSKIACMTSSHEGLPMVLIEAQKYGCVPIAYDSYESAKDIIQNNFNGLLIRPFKQKEYKIALESLMTNEERREILAHNGSDYIKKFEITNIVKQWITLFDKI